MAYSYDVIVPVGAVQVIVASIPSVLAVGVGSVSLAGKIFRVIIRTVFPSVTYSEPFVSTVIPFGEPNVIPAPIPA